MKAQPIQGNCIWVKCSCRRNLVLLSVLSSRAIPGEDHIETDRTIMPEGAMSPSAVGGLLSFFRSSWSDLPDDPAPKQSLESEASFGRT